MVVNDPKKKKKVYTILIPKEIKLLRQLLTKPNKFMEYISKLTETPASFLSLFKLECQ